MRSVTRSGPGDLTGAVRTVRAVTFAAVMLMLAVGAHAAAGGMVPGPWVTGTALVVTSVAARPLTGRERGPVAAVTAAAQLVLHLGVGLSMASGRGTGEAMPSARRHLLTGHGSGWMVGAHVGAGLAAAWWLRRGEAWAWRLVLLLAVLAGPALRWPRPAPCPHAGDLRTAPQTAVVPARGADDLRPSGTALTGGPLRRRGPPRVTRAA